MSTHLQRSFVLAGAAGALVAFAALMVMAFLPRPFAPMDHFSILSGLTKLSEPQLAAYKSYVGRNLTVDSLYLIGHVLMWFGYAALLSRSSRFIAALVGVTGFMSGWLDFTENEMRWSALKILLSGVSVPVTHIANWSVVFGLSFWALFLCALFVGMSLAPLFRFGKVMCAVALIGILAASLNYQYGFLPAFLWIIIWHALSAVFLWRERHCLAAGEA